MPRVVPARGEGGSEQPRIARFAALASEALGICLPPSKFTMLASRVHQRMRRLSIASIADYERYLFDSEHSETELLHFLDVVTTNKTDFFREPAHFELLSSVALPALARERGRGRPWTCRVWSAGCSSGEEVYTLAMVLSEYAAQHSGFEFSVWATDVSSRMLERARHATYPESVIDPVPASLRSKYLLRSRNRSKSLVRIDRSLRDRVQFEHLNFMQPSYAAPGPFDVIFFRNVLIYFDKPTQQAVIQRQCRHLRTGGFLFISHTETLTGLRVPLQPFAPAVFRKLA